MKYAEASRLASNLRNLASFIEEYGVELPTDQFHMQPEMTLNLSYATKEDMAQAARVLAKAGMVTKDFTSSYASLIKWFGKHVKIEAYSTREVVCTKKQVGTKTQNKVLRIETTEIEEVPVYEWECDPILAD